MIALKRKYNTKMIEEDCVIKIPTYKNKMAETMNSYQKRK